MVSFEALSGNLGRLVKDKCDQAIFWMALVFGLQEEIERKNRHGNTQVLKYFSMPTLWGFMAMACQVE